MAEYQYKSTRTGAMSCWIKDTDTATRTILEQGGWTITATRHDDHARPSAGDGDDSTTAVTTTTAHASPMTTLQGSAAPRQRQGRRGK